MNKNTMLCVVLKTLLQRDRILSPGKPYSGTLLQDGEDHLIFAEKARCPTDGKRNPHAFEGRFITVTRRDNGSLRFNFKEVRIGSGFNLFAFALDVANELTEALDGLVEKKVTSNSAAQLMEQREQSDARINSAESWQRKTKGQRDAHLHSGDKACALTPPTHLARQL